LAQAAQNLEFALLNVNLELVPEASRMWIEVPARGRPMLGSSEKSVRTSESVAQTVASVGPYALRIGATCAHRLARFALSGSPAEMTAEKSTLEGSSVSRTDGTSVATQPRSPGRSSVRPPR